MWQAFELIHQTFKSGAELYLEDMLPALENFINYGWKALMESPAHLDAVVDMVRTIFKDDKVGGVDRICGCKLAEMLMLNLRGGIDNYVPEFIQLAMGILTNDELKVKSYRIHLMEMIINAIYYNPRLSLTVLEANGWTNKFFSLWFSSIDSFTRVHDKKLSIGAITALLTLRADEVPTSVQQGWPRLLQGIVRLFQTLPAALKNREEAQREEDFGLSTDYDDEDEDDDEWQAEDWENEETEETTDIKDESTAYLDFLSQQAQKFNAAVGEDEGDDELEEESLLETPLDQMEPYSLFKQTLSCKYLHDIHPFEPYIWVRLTIHAAMSQQQPQLYNTLTSALGPEEQQVIKAAVENADKLEQQQAAALAESAQAQPNGAS